MENPFVFGRIASGSSFTNRRKELKHLEHNFNSGINTIIISPRRWGKSSLVAKVAQSYKTRKNNAVCLIDLFNIRSEIEFYEVFAKNVLKSCSSKWEERVELAKKYFRKLVPTIHLGQDPIHDFSVSFRWDELLKDPEEILNLPEILSKDKNIRLLVCLDEFQNIALYADNLNFQKKLRSIWQYHENATYCIYGSKRHMMTEIFENKSMPFYKFGEVLFLDKIPKEEWSEFIIRKFDDTSKKIAPDVAQKIAAAMEYHPYFVQQLAATSWRVAENECTVHHVETAMEELLDQQTIMFIREIDTLSLPQINFLKALVNGVINFTSTETLYNYKLGSPSNIQRIKKALVQKEILDIYGRPIEFVDPLFKFWFKSRYMVYN